MKVLISDSIEKECIDILKEGQALEVDVKTGLPPEELKKIIGAYSAIVVRSATKLTADILEHAKNLKVIGRAGSGLDNVDLKAATKKGIICMNTPGGNTVSTAEHTFSMLLALSRNIPQANQTLKNGVWEKKKFKGVEVYNKVLGIIGLGKIGKEVAKRAQGFGMQVLCYDPFLTADVASQLEIKLMELDDVIGLADYITVHTPLSDQTKHMISTAQFKKMKKGVRILNCARGGIIDEQALCEALKSGQVAGAALDVFEVEPPPQDHPLLAFENVIATPHLGASTEEAQVNVAIAIAHQIRDALLNNTIRNAVNAPSFDGENYERIRPYFNLAEKIGILQAQLIKGNLEAISVEYSGNVLEFDVKAVTSALVRGILYPSLKEEINYINARVFAQERGIKVTEIRTGEIGDFSSLITVTVKTDKEKREVAGTVFGKKDIRIVRIDQYRLDTIPQGYMFISCNQDGPGIIGKIGTILGKNGININNMTWGVDQNIALMALNTDIPVPDAIVKEIESDQKFLWTKVVNLN
jgi:D-3-phosphoglycerate dehydrogenase / 2-oxoglutarate reductase